MPRGVKSYVGMDVYQGQNEILHNEGTLVESVNELLIRFSHTNGTNTYKAALLSPDLIVFPRNGDRVTVKWLGKVDDLANINGVLGFGFMNYEGNDIMQKFVAVGCSNAKLEYIFWDKKYGS